MPALAFAQNSGKLAGRIVDGSTGDGLPGATVVLEGTTFGTATDLDGNYFIIGVPVGTYDVLASFVGFQTRKVERVQISTGYTREIDFVLQPGVELDEIVVTYEKPLIQKDAIGVPKIVNAEEIINLPVRGAAEVAKIQAGVVSKEGSDGLNIRGGRTSEVTYYIDGVKVVGSSRLGASGSQIGLPQSAIEEQEMIIGSINARYGDAMSGIINITTKSGSSNFFGSLEGLTSESLDDFGYTLASGTLGGPIIPGKLTFFVAGEFLNEDDGNPRSIGLFSLTDAQLDDLRASPIGFLVTDDAGNQVILPIPNSLGDGATLNVDADGNPDISGGGLVFSDGTTVAVPGNVDISTLVLNPASRAEQLTRSDFEDNLFKRAYANENLSLSGNLTWNGFKSGRL
ncbi:MAG: carboxypeptidase-like regulatory domain-containing protein, partial [Bacteroidetes bacterium]|nr:carboxypeptidase-like regulatory domain-containing protein [Bacteroidota bacterium]